MHGPCGYCSGRFPLSWVNASQRGSTSEADAIARRHVEIGTARGAQTRRNQACTGARAGLEQEVLTDHGAEIDLIADDLERVGIGDDLLVQLGDLAHHHALRIGAGTAGTSRPTGR